ncbi:PREDICTED: fractalkine [Chrysochloris asiatica]|uniref:Fractalkine n=1 Tax=Chrysochloris asiatica TaxID=185453 RepID=A0A9B0TMR5_CHRAS|nr:PREDICTED: fractalkine [Chrysochloris asiatica]
MSPLSRSWLLRLAVFCHLTILLAGQHHSVKKCRITCNKMTSRIPVTFLIHYEENHKSCGKPAIILETKQHRIFCADPMEKWVQDAMAYLDHQAAALTQNGGTFEKQIGVGEPRTTLAARGMYQTAVSEPQAAGESSSLEPTHPSQEAQEALGTSPELPTRIAGSLGTRSPSASNTELDGLPTGSDRDEFLSVASVSTTSSATYQPGSGLRAKGKASESPSTEASSTQGPSAEVPTISHPVPEASTGTEGQPVWTKEHSPMPENSPESEEMGPIPAHTDAFLDWGPGSMTHISVVPASSERAPSREPGAEGSWATKTEEPIHATVDPQRLGVLITSVPDTQVATRRQAVGLLAFLGLLFCLGVAMFAYQSLQGCSRKMAEEMVEGLRYGPRSCGSNSYVMVPV